ncbi:glycosyltransferase [Planctomonas sp. JC2975]|uniref:glycosyltransferase n=1 Tax=Planctomonas sp. JC2975 TaxID=2729626 RepID=UPI0014760A48|nr:glycosyltransferase [Planctomonas sp. JC2975]NNC13091.1 glycosyltransferase [Planctomonas sp. JC2975]
MPPTVTALVVAHRGADHLTRSLDALAAQTRPVDSVVVIGVASDEATTAAASSASPGALLASKERIPFGAAIGLAARTLPPPTSDDEWLWFLAEDTAPEPDALERMIETVAVSPSVAVAGPKLVDWDAASVLRELGIAMTRFGATIVPVQDEFDQAQHDHTSDMMAVPAAGMLVRHTVWERLGGFDPALPVFDDGLDLCVRARLAGHRVVIVPTARMASAADDVSAPRRSPKGGRRRRQHRQRRAAQLHRRMAYAPAFALFLHWLSLVPLAVLRSLGLLLSKQPGSIGGEFAAAFATAFGGSRIGPARSAIKRVRTVKWSAIAPLRIPRSEVRRARAIQREASLTRVRGERRELNFFSGGGAWVVLAMAVMSIALFSPLLGWTQIGGGGLLPLNDVGALWSSLGYGWRDIGIGFVGAADPFNAVLAILGSLTFWQPSFAIELLWFAAMPLAALGAWFLSTRLTHRPVLRATFALVWALAPMLFDALQQGRPAAVIVHILLPWLFFAGTAAKRSWAAAATTGILAAAVLACAPILAPALFVIWLIGVILARRGTVRMLPIPIPAVALFLPLVVQQTLRGTPFSVLADPGLPLAGTDGHPLHIALGFADGNLGGWQSLAGLLGISGIAPSIVVPILVAPIGILALLALFLRGTIRATLCLVGALLGFATAILTLHLSLSASGSHAVPVYAGSALSLYWLGLIAAATMALVALGRFSIAPATVAVAFLAVAIAPLAIAMPLQTSAVGPSTTSALPAYATAQAQAKPRIGTLRLTPQTDGSLGAQLVHGTGQTLDDQSTLSATSRTLTTDEKQLAVLAGNLTSTSGLNASSLLKHFGVSFVLLETTAGEGVSPASATEVRAETALDGNALLTQVASTDGAVLWSVPGQRHQVPIPPDAGGWLRVLVFIGLGVVMGLTLLLALPTGRTERGNLGRPTAAEVLGMRPEKRRAPTKRSARWALDPAPTVDNAPAADTDAVNPSDPASASDDGGADEGDRRASAPEQDSGVDPDPDPDPDPDTDSGPDRRGDEGPASSERLDGADADAAPDDDTESERAVAEGHAGETDADQDEPSRASDPMVHEGAEGGGRAQ